MIRGVEFHDLIKNIFNDVKGVSKSEQLQVNCPRCQERAGSSEPDGKFNLEINTSKRVFQCWKCEPQFSGSLGKLIKDYGSHIDYEIYKSMASSFHDYERIEDDEDFKPLFLPYKYIPFSEMDGENEEHLEAHKYLLLNRGLTNQLIEKYKLGFCVEGKYRKRIIIPSYDRNGGVNYFVARSFEKETKRPYDNPKHNKNLIFNEYFINFDSLVFLVEGVFDMFALPNSIPLLGKKINEALYFKLKEKKPDVIIALDPDAKKEEVDIYNLLKNAYGEEHHKVRVLDLKGNNDLDEIKKKYGNEELVRLLYDSRELNDDDYFKAYIY